MGASLSNQHRFKKVLKPLNLRKTNRNPEKRMKIARLEFQCRYGKFDASPNSSTSQLVVVDDEKCSEKLEVIQRSVFSSKSKTFEKRNSGLRGKRKRDTLGNRSVFKTKKNTEFKRKLDKLSKKQLVNLMIHMVELDNKIEEELERLCPSHTPDLLSFQTQLESLLNEIYKAFPDDYVGSLRNGFCFGKVQSQIAAFKNQCLSQLDSLADSDHHSLTVDYAIMAWPIVSRLPEWNHPSHNKPKESIFQSLSKQSIKSFRKWDVSLEECRRLEKRLQDVKDIDCSILPVLDEVKRKIDSFQWC